MVKKKSPAKKDSVKKTSAKGNSVKKKSPVRNSPAKKKPAMYTPANTRMTFDQFGDFVRDAAGDVVDRWKKAGRRPLTDQEYRGVHDAVNDFFEEFVTVEFIAE